jgi:hypothetical protein
MPPSKFFLFSALLLAIERGDVDAVATGGEVIRLSWPICDVVADGMILFPALQFRRVLPSQASRKQAPVDFHPEGATC